MKRQASKGPSVFIGAAVFLLLWLNGAPFILAALAGGVLYVVMDYVFAGKDAPRESQWREEDARMEDTRTENTSTPDLSNPVILRHYLRRLTQRIDALEKKLAELQGSPARDAAPSSGQTFGEAATEVNPEIATPAQTQPPPFEPPAEPVDVQPAPEVVQPAPIAAQFAQAEEAAKSAEVPESVAPSVALALSTAEKERSREPDSRGVPFVLAQSSERDERGAGSGRTRAEQPEQTVPDEPSLLQALFTWMFSGNLVAKAGAVILFLGVGFLLKFAYDHSVFPPEARLVVVAIAAVAAFVTGSRLMVKRPVYGLILQGVASGLAYIDVFFALKTFALISPVMGFSLFALLGVATTMRAVKLNAQSLAVLGLFGAFLAPLLASTGQGSHQLLFSYYLLLNLFILAVSWFKAWRPLNLTGWFFTFAVAVLWGSQSYRPELFWSVEPFLVAFFIIYLVIPILFATRQAPELKGIVDGTLVFGTPAAVAFLQARLVWDMPYGLAWSCAAGAAIYALLCASVWRHTNMRLLAETYIALAVGLGTLSIFYAFGAYTTFALWSIEGAAILWVGLRQDRRMARLFGLGVQLAGALRFAAGWEDYSHANPWFNDAVLGCAIIAVASLISAYLMRRHRDRISELEGPLAVIVLLWGALWWLAAGVDVIHHALMPEQRVAATLLFVALSAVLAELSGAFADWTALRRLSWVLLPGMLYGAMAMAGQHSHPLTALGWLAWPLALGSHFWMLYRRRRDGFDTSMEPALFLSGWLFLGLLATWEALYRIGHKEYFAAMLIALVVLVAAALRRRFTEHTDKAFALSTLALGWSLFFWFMPGLMWIQQELPSQYHVRAMLAFVTVSSLLFELAHRPLAWPALGAAGRLIWLFMPLAALLEMMRASHPFTDAWSLAWPAALAVAMWALRREERESPGAGTNGRHALALLLVTAFATWELNFRVADWEFGSAWAKVALALPATLALLVLALPRLRNVWPLGAHWDFYRDRLLAVVAGLLLVWSLQANIAAPGGIHPLSTYIPMLNPIDAAMALIAFAVYRWGRELDQSWHAPLWKLAAVPAFVWLNGLALRCVHFWADVPYRIDVLAESVVVQATLSLLWTATAFVLMLTARRSMKRGVWLVGAGLLVVVVAKLFLLDLANSGTVERIVSFLGVGVGLLVIGYFAPVPPGQAAEAEPVETETRS